MYNRLLVPLIAADQPKHHPNYARALRTLDRHIDSYTNRARRKPPA